MTKKNIYRGILLLLAAGAFSAIASAAGTSEPTSLTADALSYDTQTGLVTAENNVRMEQGTGHIEGQRATYNVKTQEGTVEGGVTAVRDDMQLTCDRLFAQGQNHWQATGSVRMVKADRTFTGPQADYYPAQNDYLLAASGGTITSADGTISADRLEGLGGILERVGQVVVSAYQLALQVDQADVHARALDVYADEVAPIGVEPEEQGEAPDADLQLTLALDAASVLEVLEDLRSCGDADV